MALKKKKEKSISRLKWLIFKNQFRILYLHNKCKSIAKKDKMSFEDRFAFAIKWVKVYHKSFKVELDVTGLDNIPEDIKGCIFAANHQGQDDCVAILQAIEKYPSSFLINDARSHVYLMGPVCDMLNAKRINFNDLKSQLKIYNSMSSEIEEGKRFVIFPEAKYDDNKNTMIEFNTPCFVPAMKSKCPIIPVCLYDSWRVYKDPTKKKVKVGVHILKPIYYEEYASLNKQELAKLTQNRIQEKLDEIENK